jgi:CMP-N-acetylneuraminic acid synthetase
MVVLLQPTCPIRDSAHIDAAVRLLAASDLETLAAVEGPFKKRFPILKAIRSGVLESYVRDEVGPDVESFYLYNASIYAAKRTYLMRVGEVMGINVKSVPLVMDRFHSADIDELADVAVVEAYFKYLDEHRLQGGQS